jgi:membrane-associated protease RseP (regulator of RpoE activity)
MGQPGRDDDRAGPSVGHSHGRSALSTVARTARAALVAIVILALLVLVFRNHLAYAAGIVIFVAALLVSVMLHEFGHFITAKKFHMRVTQFFIGFGTTLWSFFRGETEYGVKALPFGGFVRISGMTSVEEIDVADEPRSFRRQPGWQRIIVLAAGSFMHFLLALFLFFVLALAVGQPNENTNVVSQIAGCVPRSYHVLENDSNPCAGPTLGKSPAELAGMKANDKIISVAGQQVGTWDQLHSVLKKQPVGVPIPVVVQRSGHDVKLDVTLAKVPGDSTPYLGVDSAVIYQRSGPIGSVGYAGSQFADTVTSSASAIGKLPSAIPDLFNKDRAATPAGQVGSVVGVGEVTGDVVQANLPWQAKVTLVLYLVASLNIFVGLFNLLPLLPLDGGHLAVVIFERIRAWFYRLFGRPDPGLVDIQKLVPVSLLVFAVLVGVGTLLIAADIFNPIHLQV